VGIVGTVLIFVWDQTGLKGIASESDRDFAGWNQA
jgi:hypothetical protein